MFGIFEDGPDTRSKIEKYFDELYYWEHRDIVYEARKNNLHNAYPNVPFSAKEVLEYALKDCEDSIIPGASCNAIDGAENYTALMGEPELDPLTGKQNSIEDRTGLIDHTITKLSDGVNEAQKKLFTAIVILGIGYVVVNNYTKARFK